MSAKRILLESISFSTSRGRVIFFMSASLLIYVLPISVLAGFSLWSKLGVPSPSIGLTRAYHYILHGDFNAAWAQNNLIFVVLVIGLPIIAKDVYTVLKLKQGIIRHGRSKQPKSTTIISASTADSPG